MEHEKMSKVADSEGPKPWTKPEVIDIDAGADDVHNTIGPGFDGVESDIS